MNDNSLQVITPEQATAMAISFHEEVGMGAISRAGALPSGVSGEWIKYAEEKLKKENSLDFQSLLWEVGNRVVEQRQIEQKGFNLTHEQEVLDRIVAWFTGG